MDYRFALIDYCDILSMYKHTFCFRIAQPFCRSIYALGFRLIMPFYRLLLMVLLTTTTTTVIMMTGDNYYAYVCADNRTTISVSTVVSAMVLVAFIFVFHFIR